MIHRFLIELVGAFLILIGIPYAALWLGFIMGLN